MSPNNRIGPFVTLRELGRGGMGIVFEARHVETGEAVALKILLGNAALESVMRFEREAAVLSRLSHPNLVRLHSVGTDELPPWIAMELIDGEPLSARIGSAPKGRLGADEVQRLGIAVSSALLACHRASLMHRDVKPENILLRRDGEPVLVDLGLARREGDSGGQSIAVGTLTATGMTVGTPMTMAPEQFDSESYGKPGAAADVWGLSATLYLALCGRPPFAGKLPLAILTAIQSGPPAAPEDLHDDIPSWLSEIILDGLLIQPGERLDMESLHERLQTGAAGAPRRAPARSSWSRVLAPVVMTLLILVGVAAGAWLPESPATLWRDTDALLADAEDGGASTSVWQALARRSRELDEADRARLLDALAATIRNAKRAGRGTGSGPGADDFATLIRLDPTLRESHRRARLMAERPCPHARHAAWLEARPLNREALEALESIALDPAHREGLRGLCRDDAIAVLEPARRRRLRARLLELDGRPGEALELLESMPASSDEPRPELLLAQAAQIAFLYRRDEAAAELLDSLLERRRAAADPTQPSVDTIELVIRRRRLHLRRGEDDAAVRLLDRWRALWPHPLWDLEAKAGGLGAPPWPLPDRAAPRDPILTALLERLEAELIFARFILSDLALGREALLRLRLAGPDDLRLALHEYRCLVKHGDVFQARAFLEGLKPEHGHTLAWKLEQAAADSYLQDFRSVADIVTSEECRTTTDPRLRRAARELAAISTETGLAELRAFAARPEATLPDRISHGKILSQSTIERPGSALSEDNRAALASCRAILQALLEDEARLVRVWIALAEIESRLDDERAARAALARAEGIVPHPGAALRRIMLASTPRNRPETITRLRELAEKAPHHVRTRFFLLSYLTEADAPAAEWLPLARAAMRRFPNDPKVQSYYLGGVAKAGSHEDLELVRRAWEVLPPSPAFRLSMLHSLTAILSRRDTPESKEDRLAIARFVHERARALARDHGLAIKTRRRALTPLYLAARTLDPNKLLVPALETCLRVQPESKSLVTRYLALMTKAKRTREVSFHLFDSVSRVPKAARFVVDHSLKYERIGTALVGFAGFESAGALTTKDALGYAGLLITVGRFERALAQLEEVLAADPSDPVAHALRIGALIALGDDDRARAATISARLVAAPEPVVSAAGVLLGVDSVEQELRRRELTRLIDSEYWRLTKPRLADLAFRRFRPHEARILGSMLGAVWPEDPEVPWLLFHLATGREPIAFVVVGDLDLDRAAEILQAGLARSPGDPGLRWARARLRRLRAGRVSPSLSRTDQAEARAILSELQDAGARPDVQLSIAWKLMDRSIIETLRPSVESPGVELLAGTIRGLDESVRYTFRKLLRLADSEPTNALLHLQAARAQLTADPDKPRTVNNGVLLLARVLELAPGHREALRTLHELHASTTKDVALLTGARAARQARPGDPLALEIVIKAALALERLDEAREAAALLRAQQPDHPALRRPELDAPADKSQREAPVRRAD